MCKNNFKFKTRVKRWFKRLLGIRQKRKWKVPKFIPRPTPSREHDLPGENRT